jgi:diguanylate cyclase (GGDEF)-like protein/PAS domain S-box-containing protein
VEGHQPYSNHDDLESALWNAHEQLAALTRGTSVAIYALDPQGRVLQWNPACERMFGWAEDEVLGRVLPIVPETELENFHQMIAGIVAGDGLVEYAALRRRRDGSAVELSLSAAPVRNRRGEVVAIVVTGADNTERGRAQRNLQRSERRFEALVEAVTDAIAVVAVDGTFSYLSPSAESVLGMPTGELFGRRMQELIHPDDAETVAALLGDDDTERLTFRLAIGDSVRWVEAGVHNLLEDPAIEGTVLDVRDITDRRRAEDLLAAHSRVLGLVARGRPLSETLDVLCREFEHLVAGALCTVMLPSDSEAVLVPAAGPSLPKAVTEAIAAGIPIASGSGACGHAAFHRRLVVVEDVAADALFDDFRDLALANDLRACWSSPMLSSPGGDFLGTFAVYYRTTRRPTDEELSILSSLGDLAAVAIEHKQVADRLAYLGLHDPLTGLPNRLLLLDRLEHAIDQIERRGEMVAVLFCDLDRFKVINDSLGHEVGDQLLTAAAARLQATLRAGDTAARFGGDEFVLLCEGVESASDVVAIAERAGEALREPFVVVGNGEVHLSCSTGISVARTREAQPETLLQQADAAMYQAKEHGKGRFELFDDEMQRQALVRLEVEHALHGAVERGELRVYYQPVVSLIDGSVVAVEALVRWLHPERGVIPPGQFIAVAEETGLICAIGAYVLDTACRQTAAWQASTPLAVSVNLSTRQLRQADLPALVAATLADSGIDPSSLWLEVTETALMVDGTECLAALVDLRHLGVSIAIDDFGTGYSSLNYLQQLPVDRLKIDQSFVAGLGGAGLGSAKGAIAQAVISLAHVLGLQVIAEGVDTVADLEQLRRFGCDLGQGWLFSKALPPEDLTALLASGPLL